MGQENSCKTLIIYWGASDHASHAPQLRYCNYYVYVVACLFEHNHDLVLWVPTWRKLQLYDELYLHIIRIPHAEPVSSLLKIDGLAARGYFFGRGLWRYCFNITAIEDDNIAESSTVTFSMMPQAVFYYPNELERIDTNVLQVVIRDNDGEWAHNTSQFLFLGKDRQSTWTLVSGTGSTHQYASEYACTHIPQTCLVGI